MPEKLNPEAIYAEVQSERNSKLAKEAAKLALEAAEQNKKNEVLLAKTSLQANIVPEIIRACPDVAKLLKTEERKYDGHSVVPVQKYYKREKDPRPIFGKKYEEGYETVYKADKQVWFVTAKVLKSTWTVDEAKTVRGRVPDHSDYVTYHETKAEGLCLDETGIMYKYKWSSTDNLYVGMYDNDRKSKLKVYLSDPENNDIIPLHTINEQADNNSEILASWQDNFKQLLRGTRFDLTI